MKRGLAVAVTVIGLALGGSALADCGDEPEAAHEHTADAVPVSLKIATSPAPKAKPVKKEAVQQVPAAPAPAVNVAKAPKPVPAPEGSIIDRGVEIRAER